MEWQGYVTGGWIQLKLPAGRLVRKEMWGGAVLLSQRVYIFTFILIVAFKLKVVSNYKHCMSTFYKEKVKSKRQNLYQSPHFSPHYRRVRYSVSCSFHTWTEKLYSQQPLLHHFSTGVYYYTMIMISILALHKMNMSGLNDDFKSLLKQN